MNPYTRIGYGNSTDEEGDFKPAPSNSYGTKDTGKTKRRNPYTSVGFGDEETRGSEPTDEEKQIAAERKKKEEEKKNRNPFAKLWDQVNVLDSGKSWKTATPSAEQADKSLATQSKELVSGFFSGTEKLGDSLEALTGIAERRVQGWDKDLKEGKITREQYQKLLDNQLKDTAWAGTKDKGFVDRLAKSAGVSLSATSEIVPFMKASKAAQLTAKGGATFGAITGATHGTGEALSDGELTMDDLKSTAIETFFGGAGGAAGGKLAQWLAGRKAAKLAARETALINGQMDEAAASAINGMDAEDAFKASQSKAITDPARLLPDGSASRAMRLAEVDAELDQFRMGQNNVEAKTKLYRGAADETAMARDRGRGTSFSTSKSVADKFAVNDELGFKRNKKGIVGEFELSPDAKIMKASNYPDINKDMPALVAKAKEEGFDAIDLQGNVDPNLGYAPESEIRVLNKNAVTRVTDNSSATAARARELMRERQQLLDEIDKIQDPAVKTAEGINLVEADLAKAQASGKTADIKTATKQQEYMQSQAAAVDRDEAITQAMQIKKPSTNVGGQTKVSTLGQKTEALAIEKKLSEGFDNLPTYQTTSLADEASTVIEHMNRDMEGATRIALGIDAPPQGVTGNSYYVGLANRAAKTGDEELIRRLGTESSRISQASRMGQEISALQNLDPESPITAVKNVLKAREKGQPKLPATISIEETRKITELSRALSEAKDAALNGGDKMAYGNARIAYDNYVADLVANSGPSLKEALQRNPAQFAKDAVLNAAGATKSMVATLDNSVIGRQGWKTLMTSPKTWAKNSLKSFQDIAKTLKGSEVLDYVHADVISRDNALNGMYKSMGLDVYGTKKNFLEEAFPVSFEKFGKTGVGKQVAKPFKASEVAFSAWQQRTRADLADQYLTIAKNMGVDLTSKKELQAIGKMVNSLTSRGHLGNKGEKWADGLNKLFFAPRLVKSHIDVLGGHVITGAGGSNFVRKQAAKNLLKIAVGSAMALKLASAATGGSIETDPRSSNFGKVKIGDTRFDLSGGMAGLLTLGSRLITQESKSSSTNEVKKLNTGEFGSQNTYDVLLSFGENKLSPLARSATDFLKGEDFDGKKPTVGSTVKNLTIPLILRQYEEVANAKNGANVMATMISEALGVSTNTYGMDKDWNADKGKQVNEFKSKVSSESFSKANDTFNSQFTDWYNSVSADDRFWKLPQDQRLQLVTNKKRSLTDEVMGQYGYKYKQPEKSDTNKALMEELKKYQN